MRKIVDEIIEFNKNFVLEKEYEKYLTSKFPNKKTAILSCMDTRLITLLPAALGLENGDVKIIKNAGAVISQPFGSVMRSLLICIYDMGVTEILVIGHYDCGMQHLNAHDMIEKMLARGIPESVINKLKAENNFNQWLSGFDNVEDSVREAVSAVKNHPLVPTDITVTGFIMDPQTGQLSNV